jgi:hypothetical protein
VTNKSTAAAKPAVDRSFRMFCPRTTSSFRVYVRRTSSMIIVFNFLGQEAIKGNTATIRANEVV